MGKTTFLGPAVVVALISLSGCRAHNDATDDQNDECVDALCYSICEKALLEQFERVDYLTVGHAYCYSNSECSCSYGCDPDACALYCQESADGIDGECDFLSCVCTYRSQTDGGDASEAN